jgi:hypothetical protein
MSKPQGKTQNGVAENGNGIEMENKTNGASTNGGKTKGSILKTIGLKRDPSVTKADAAASSSKTPQKKGKVSFRANLVDVREVENWKQYNVESSEEQKKCCNIF